MSEPTASPLIGPDDSHFTPVALSGSPAPQPAEATRKAIELLSGKPIPAPQPAKTKTLAQLAAEIFAEGAE